MKKNFTLVCAGIAFVCSSALAQKPAEKKPVQKAKPAVTAPVKSESSAKQNETGMDAWMSYMTPGPMHEMIAKSNGEWNEEVTLWMTPGAPPTKNKATCSNYMIMGNRYQESIHKGEMQGMPFEGRNLLGYDNAKKVFVSMWIDNMGTGMMFMEGKWDEASKTVNFTGKAVDPMTGKDMRVREVFKIIDDNNHFLEMYMTQNGKEFKTMEIKLTR